MPSIVIATLLAVLLPLPMPAAGCADVQVIGVRGSGQSGFGEQVGDVVTELEQVLSERGLDVAADALDYPAISVTDSLGLVLLTGQYDESVALGVVALREALEDIAARCPTSDIVLVGYSQGAQVIKASLATSVPRGRLGGIVLLADPTRDPEQVGVVRLGDPTAMNGGTFGSIPVPSHLRPLTYDVCAPGDGVCDRGGRSLAAHIDGYDGVSGEVVPLLSARLSGGLLPMRMPR